jgi:hypothetical protein
MHEGCTSALRNPHQRQTASLSSAHCDDVGMGVSVGYQCIQHRRGPTHHDVGAAARGGGVRSCHGHAAQHHERVRSLCRRRLHERKPMLPSPPARRASVKCDRTPSGIMCPTLHHASCVVHCIMHHAEVREAGDG